MPTVRPHRGDLLFLIATSVLLDPIIPILFKERVPMHITSKPMITLSLRHVPQ